MREQEARQLSEQISQQFPHVETHVLESNDPRREPYNWFVTVERASVEACLYIHSRQEWIDAVEALSVLSEEK